MSPFAERAKVGSTGSKSRGIAANRAAKTYSRAWRLSNIIATAPTPIVSLTTTSYAGTKDAETYEDASAATASTPMQAQFTPLVRAAARRFSSRRFSFIHARQRVSSSGFELYACESRES